MQNKLLNGLKYQISNSCKIVKTICIQQFKNIQWLFCLDDNDERTTSNNISCE